MEDRATFFAEQLRRAGVRVFGEHNQSDDLQAYCFQGHDSKSASLYVHKATGAFYCHGCGVHGSNWNALRAYIDIEPLDAQELPSNLQVMAAKIKKRRKKEKITMAIPWGTKPWEGPWKDVKEKLLQKIGALKWFDPGSRCYRILLPIYMYGKLEGWTARRLDDTGNERGDKPYRNAPNMSSKELLYPYDLIYQSKLRTIALVEGPYDALRLASHKIPALAILGTKNYTETNKIHLLNLGVRHIIVTMDEDGGGEAARLEIALDLRNYFEVSHFRANKGADPGNMEMPYVNKLRQLTRSQ